MRVKLKNLIPPLILTLLVLLFSDILITTFLPFLGVDNFRIPVNILLILYLSFKLEVPWIAVFVLVIEYVHAFFTIEGWALGTFSGVVISMVASYLRDLIHLTSFGLTIIITMLFQVLWLVIYSILFYIRIENFEVIVSKLWRFIPEAILAAFIAPFLFAFLDKIWRSAQEGQLSESV